MSMTELYKVPRHSRIELERDRLPPVELEFDHIDGMYSLCYTDEGSILHVCAWTPVRVLREGPKS